MAWIDAYAEMYQRTQGFKITILAKPDNKKAFISNKPTTRAAYDNALTLRESSIDTIITMDNIDTNFLTGRLFYYDDEPTFYYIIQTRSRWEQQPNTRNANAILCNATVTCQRYGYKDEKSTEEEWYNVYENIPCSISEVFKDGKNFDAGLEVNTQKNIQFSKYDLDDKPLYLKEGDRFVVSSLNGRFCSTINAEAVDDISVSGVIRVMGTQDTREG